MEVELAARSLCIVGEKNPKASVILVKALNSGGAVPMSSDSVLPFDLFGFG